MTALAKLEKGQFVEFVKRPAPAPKPEAQCHYMLRLHPNFEMKAERQLHERDIDAYVPKEKRSVPSVWTRRVLRPVPMFSGIMFIPDYHADLVRLKSIADGIGGYVRNGDGEPMKVSLFWMEKIRRFELRVAEDGPPRRFKQGDRAKVRSGAFENWEFKVYRLDSHYRLAALIEIMGREVEVMFDEDQLEAV
ncbi:Transcription antitermination factor NusG [Bradyrhizobium brasilense]|uniref:Transcription antitermination factor NusG n=1 Tax=Bradyrhizobium brasilense TaxID=1419277 RepID=A0A1G6YVL9_9BRAD|nr:transcription termination/antitermination NusG family protein [Bradyrhizobium brasilense]SDD94439.1 Transcription antitermination factor NusG [Bradyrhizobium brasilense]